MLESMDTWAQESQPGPPQLGSQGRGPGGCVGTDGMGAMRAQAAHSCINHVGLHWTVQSPGFLHDAKIWVRESLNTAEIGFSPISVVGTAQV